MENKLTMSAAERTKIKVIHQLEAGELLASEASELLGISERHVYRLKSEYQARGDVALVHGLRGKRSNRGHSVQVREEVLRLYRERYQDYGPTLFTERLLEKYAIKISVETTRQWLLSAGLWIRTRAERRHRKRRARRTMIGELVQFDGSHHQWFENRGETCCLLVAVDDATSRIFLRFAPSENARDVMQTLWDYMLLYGIPRCLYTDHGSVYYAGTTPTDVVRALRVLGTEIIHARSPQAKGRVERSNRTHQDRLIKTLREENISSIAEANRFLTTSYIADHNARFVSTDGLRDAHRPVDGYDLKNIFCFEEQRTVYNDYTIRLDAQPIQLLKSHVPLPPPKQKVLVRRHLDDSLHIFWREKELQYTPLDEKPSRVAQSLPMPADNHPWRHKKPIGRARRK